jgi:hypothetical protein
VIKQIKKYDWLFVVCLFFIAELLINPIGEFPLNDDWAYAKAINDYLNTGLINFSFWQAIPDLPQFLIGLVGCKLFCFSFTLLRFISIVCVVIMIYVFNGILKRQEIKSGNRMLLMLLFVFNPLTISLGNTFLPDIMKLFFSLISVSFIFKYVKNQNFWCLFWFSVFSLLATLNRQSAVVVPLAFALVYFWMNEKNKKNMILFFSPFIFNVIALIVYQIIAKHLNKLPGNYNLQINNMLNVFAHPSINHIKSIAYYIITSSLCLGLLILPLTVSSFVKNFQSIKKSLLNKTILVIYLIIVALKIIFSGNILPFVGNIFYHFGIGPIILTDFNTNEKIEISIYAQIIWCTLNFVGAYSFYISLRTILLKPSFINSFFVVFLILYLLPICIGYANDRYLLYLLPFYFLAYYLSNDFKINKFSYLLVSIPIFYFSIAGTHDYLAINRARWNATNHLMRDLNISPNKIDGGFEFNAWYLAPSNNYFPSHNGRWWWVEGDDYVIGTSILQGYTIESEHLFNLWMPFKSDKILVLRKIPE